MITDNAVAVGAELVEEAFAGGGGLVRFLIVGCVPIRMLEGYHRVSERITEYNRRCAPLAERARWSSAQEQELGVWLHKRCDPKAGRTLELDFRGKWLPQRRQNIEPPEPSRIGCKRQQGHEQNQ